MVIKVGDKTFVEEDVVAVTREGDPTTDAIVYLQGGHSLDFSGADAVVVWDWWTTTKDVKEL